MSFKDLINKVQSSYDPQDKDLDVVVETKKTAAKVNFTDVRDCKPSVFAIIYYDSKLNDMEEIKPVYDQFMSTPNERLYFNGCKVSRFLKERLMDRGIEIRPSIKNALDDINRASWLYRRHSINSQGEDFITANMGGDAMTFMDYTDLMFEYAACKDQSEVFECMKKEEAYLAKIKESRMQKELEK